MKQFISPRQLALATGASESSVKRWADEGLLTASRTAGGHRRIRVEDAVAFVRSRGLHAADPSLLGLPCSPRDEAGGSLDLARSADALYECLLATDADAVAGCLLALYLQGVGVAELADGPLAGALDRLGELWRHDEAGVVLEHCATDACVKAVARLRSLVAVPSPEAPIAVGGAPAGDPYTLPSMLAGAVLAEEGWREFNLGADTPAGVLGAAMRRYRPALVWRAYAASNLSARAIREDLDEVLAAAEGVGAVVVAGGRALGRGRLPTHPALHRASRMGDLVAFARGLRAATRAPEPATAG